MHKQAFEPMVFKLRMIIKKKFRESATYDSDLSLLLLFVNLKTTPTKVSKIYTTLHHIYIQTYKHTNKRLHGDTRKENNLNSKEAITWNIASGEEGQKEGGKEEAVSH